MSALPKEKYTLEEYLELDRNSDERLEFWDGEVFSMSGVSDEHDRIEGNIYFHLRSHSGKRGCRVFLANMRIKVPTMEPNNRTGTSLAGTPVGLAEEVRFELTVVFQLRRFSRPLP